MLKATYARRMLHFKEEAVTSRGAMRRRECWFVKVWEEEEPERFGVGECALFRGLSAEDVPGYEEQLARACARVNVFQEEEWREWSSICFGMETALADLAHGGQRLPFPSAFTRGEATVEINGLVWMGRREQVARRVEEKLAAGCRCLKLKIGALAPEDDMALLRSIRERFPATELEVRVDANGAFSPGEAPRVLECLARYDVHSIEQPIARGQWREMRALCAASPVPVALDEELIGVYDREMKVELLETVAPRFLVIKPSLVGGFASSMEWIELARERGIGWWITSALESNVGLNAIAQWCARLGTTTPQGLGTGLLYTDNIPSPLVMHGQRLGYRPDGTWDLSSLVFFHDERRDV
jgi:o-succinylbenzoate synthase